MDAFLATIQVGPIGLAIGVDITTQTLDRARHNASTQEVDNISFQLGEIERLPVADNSVDIITSNCVINLSPDKNQVFREVFQTLNSRGQLATSDVVARGKLPVSICNDTGVAIVRMGGASPTDTLKCPLGGISFNQVSAAPKDGSGDFIRKWQGAGIEDNARIHPHSTAQTDRLGPLAATT